MRHQAAQGHRGEQKEESMGKTCTLTKRRNPAWAQSDTREIRERGYGCAVLSSFDIVSQKGGESDVILYLRDNKLQKSNWVIELILVLTNMRPRRMY